MTARARLDSSLLLTDQRPFTVDADEGGLVVVHPRLEARPRGARSTTLPQTSPNRSVRRFRIPRWAAATLTWWWATEEARQDPPFVTERARRVVWPCDARRAGRLADVLDADTDDWSRWPVTVDGGGRRRVVRIAADFGFKRRLLPFQLEQVARLLNSGDGCNFSVPGSGKTTVTYAVWGALRSAGLVQRTVVVVAHYRHTRRGRSKRRSASIREAAHGCTPAAASRRRTRRPQLRGPSGPRAARRRARMVARRTVDGRARRGAPSEAGRSGLRGAAALALADAADHRLILTGTPAPNGPVDLAAMFDLAWPGSGRALVRDGRNRRCFVRATKSDLGLPPQRMEVERVPMSAAHSQLYSAMTDAAARCARGASGARRPHACRTNSDVAPAGCDGPSRPTRPSCPVVDDRRQPGPQSDRTGTTCCEERRSSQVRSNPPDR